MTNITIARLERAINDCRRVQPPVDYVLGPDLRKLATIWGEMIAKREAVLGIDTQSEARKEVLIRWLGAAAGPSAQISEPTAVQAAALCQLGDTNAGACEACQ
ncbi:MAG: DUF3717 domain-containing protein [Massilia sp.]